MCLPPLSIGIYFKRKEFAQQVKNMIPVSNFSAFKVDPFQKSLDMQERKQEVMKVVSLFETDGKFTKCIQDP